MISPNENEEKRELGDTPDGEPFKQTKTKSDKIITVIIIANVLLIFISCSTFVSTIVIFNKLQGIRGDLKVINDRTIEELNKIVENLEEEEVSNITTKFFSLRGPKGEKGEVGVKGEAIIGHRGPPGQPGSIGVFGVRGLRGPMGFDGALGRFGPQGIPGVDGKKGDPCYYVLLSGKGDSDGRGSGEAISKNCKKLDGGCLKKLVQYGSSSYVISTIPSNWSEAQASCRRFGAHLVEIKDAEENSFIKKHLLECFSRDNFWIGLSNISTGNAFIWMNNGTKVDFEDWAPDGHNYDDVNGCLELRSDQNFRWNNDECHYNKNFICEVTDL